MKNDSGTCSTAGDSRVWTTDHSAAKRRQEAVTAIDISGMTQAQAQAFDSVLSDAIDAEFHKDLISLWCESVGLPIAAASELAWGFEEWRIIPAEEARDLR